MASVTAKRPREFVRVEGPQAAEYLNRMVSNDVVVLEIGEACDALLLTAKGRVVLTSDASHFYRNVERFQPVQIITSLPEMLAGFETIHRLAGAPERIVAGHDPEVATRFETIEPGIIRIA